MKRYIFITIAGILLNITLTVKGFCQEPAVVELPQGVQAVWDLTKATHETTSTRERICVNGLWRWQPVQGAQNLVPAGDWGYFKVPGPWPGNNDWMQKESQTVYAHPAWKSQDLSKVGTAWYQREITIPQGWTGRRISLYMEYLNSYAAVYVDGKKTGEIRFPAGEADLSSVCRPGGKYVLSLMVMAVPLKAVMVSAADTSAPKEVEGSVERRGLCGDVYLQSTPQTARLEDTQIQTSVRQGAVTFRTALQGLDPGASYNLSARIMEKGKVVKLFQSRAFKAADLQDGRITFSGKWKPTRLWDTDTPQNTYQASFSLMNAGGKVLDTVPSVTFGFREFWIEGKDFYLNGTRVFCSALPEDSAAIGAGMANYAAARETFERLKSAGFNAVYGHNYGCEPGTHLSFTEVLKAADDAGMLFFFSQPHFEQYDWDASDTDQTNGYAGHAAFYARAAGTHPSVVMYAMSHNALGYGEEDNPDLMDGLKDLHADDWSARNAKKAARAEALVRRLDPGRIVYHHSSGNFGTMHTVNFYLNFVPSQELSDWFGHWSTAGVKPLFLCEFGCPLSWDWTMYRGWYKGQREFGSAPVPWELCVAEWDAQFEGDKAYQIREVDKRDLRWEAKQFAEGKVWHRWDYPTQVGENLSADQSEVLAGYFKDSLRALRTWGLSGYCLWDHEQHWKPREGVDKGRKNLEVDWANLQRPGFSPDFVEDRYNSFEVAYDRADWKPTVAGQAILRNNGPLLGYIGGKAAAFTSKDHNFYPGETVEKQLILINSSRRAVACTCAWSLNLSPPVTGQSQLKVKAGEQKRLPLNLALPEQLEPGAYNLSATFQYSNGETQEDSFAIHVLSRAAPKLKGRIALFDPKGETAKALTGLGVVFDKVEADADFSTYDVLMIGKSALTLDGAAPNIDRVPQGLKVVLFEQSSEVLEQRLGFRVEEYGLRQVFKRVPDSPLLSGLSVENLGDWRGDATILSPRLKYELKPEHGPTIKWCGIDVSRPWRCGCRGNVASVLIEKPARGNFLPILDGGYSLQFSPLMEYREGKGMVLFCQMDVTGRTENDPAAERLLGNILNYVSTWKPAPSRKTLYSGEVAGKKFLESTGLTVDSYNGGRLSQDQVLVVGPGSKLNSHSGDVDAWLKAGGNLLALGLDEKEANAFLPLKVGMKKAEHIASYFEPLSQDSLLAGVGPADVHNRDPRELPLIFEGAKVVGDGVLAQAENSHVLFCQMVPWQFPYEKNYGLKRTFRRVSFLVTRLLANLGAAGSTPLLARVHTAPDAAKPEKRWLEGFYLDQPEEWDDPYRFFGW